MDFENYLRYGLGLILVVGLIALMPVIARRFGMAGLAPRQRNKRLSVIEVTTIDAKRRLVLVRRDAIEHLILLGANAETVIERAIAPMPNPAAGLAGDKPSDVMAAPHLRSPRQTEEI